jgi:hypothetical protein
MQSNEHIELDDFDREYGLVDLMPQALAAQVLGGLEGQVRFSILLPDGGLYYNGDGTLTRLLNDAAEKIAQKGNARIRSNDGVETAVVFHWPMRWIHWAFWSFRK